MSIVPTIPRIERFIVADIDRECHFKDRLREIFPVADSSGHPPVVCSFVISPKCAEALGVNLSSI